MTYEKNLLEPVELNELELDAVAGGAPVNVSQRAREALIAAQVSVNVSDNAIGVCVIVEDCSPST